MEINHPGSIHPIAIPASYQLGILDASALHDIQEIDRAIRHHLVHHGHENYISAKPSATEELLGRLDTGRMMGVFHHGQIVGCAYLGQTTRIASQDGVPGMNICYEPTRTAVLRNSMVHPLHQGHGLGRKLCQMRVEMAQKLGYWDLVSGVTASNVQSWHNLIHAGLKLVQVSPLPPEISPNNTTLAFYFHRQLNGESMPDPIEIKRRIIDPLAEGELFQKMIAEGWRHSASEKRDGRMMLALSQFLTAGSAKPVPNKHGGWGMGSSSSPLPTSQF